MFSCCSPRKKKKKKDKKGKKDHEPYPHRVKEDAWAGVRVTEDVRAEVKVPLQEEEGRALLVHGPLRVMSFVSLSIYNIA